MSKATEALGEIQDVMNELEMVGMAESGHMRKIMKDKAARLRASLDTLRGAMGCDAEFRKAILVLRNGACGAQQTRREEDAIAEACIVIDARLAADRGMEGARDSGPLVTGCVGSSDWESSPESANHASSGRSSVQSRPDRERPTPPAPLKPCPFCGGTTVVVHEGRYGCINGMCAAEAPIEAWNKRTPALSPEEREAIKWAYDAAASEMLRLSQLADIDEAEGEMTRAICRRDRSKEAGEHAATLRALLGKEGT